MRASARRVALKYAMARQDYVNISREMLEDWLTSNFQSNWSRSGSTSGVYLVHLSDKVAVKISSALSSSNRSMGRGQASMNLSLVSRVDGRTLNAKSRDRKHFQRTTNWKATWLKGVKHWQKVYSEKSDFYNKFADKANYVAKWKGMIDKIPYAGSDRLLISLRDKLEGGDILFPNQEQIILDRHTQSQQRVQNAWVTPLPIDKLRLMWVWGRDHRNEEVKEVAKRLGLQSKAGELPSEQDIRDYNRLRFTTLK